MISVEVHQKLHQWFKDYTASFKSESAGTQQDIQLKIDHTLRVCEESRLLARALQLSESDVRLAGISALLHDIGRFEQLMRYGTFVDLKSVNHAELGVSIVQEKNILADLKQSDQQIILESIAQHNRKAITEDQSGSIRLFVLMLRDADKLDIWRIASDYYVEYGKDDNVSIGLDLPDLPEINPDVCEAVLNGEMVSHSMLRTLNDFKVLQMGWVYDLNFSHSFCRLQEKGYLKIIESTLPQTQMVQKIVKQLDEVMDEKIRLSESEHLSI